MEKYSLSTKATTILLFLGATTSISAQTKHWEHNVYAGVGIANTLEDGDEQTTALHVGYGLNYYVTPQWSAMPGVALRVKTRLGELKDGGGSYNATYIDVPLLMQYHFSGSKREGVVVECGPVFSFLADGDYHYYDADPWHPIDGKEEYKKFDLGIRPAVYYETRHWRFGVQSYIGLLDTKRKYPPYVTDRYHAVDVVATVNFHW